MAIPEGVLKFRRQLADRLRGEPSIKALVDQGLQLGKEPHLSRPLWLDLQFPWLITIGDHVVLSPNVMILCHDPSLRQHTGVMRVARVVVGDRVVIGAGAILLPGTILGEDSVVAAGAVVHGEVPPSSMVAGNPGKVSKITPIAAWQRASAAKAPNWPVKGWSLLGGISEENKRAQREALAGGASGYIPARTAPEGPFHAKKKPRPEADPAEADRAEA